MALMKRKAVTDERPSKKVKGAKEEQDTRALKNPRPSKPEDIKDGELRPGKKSILSEEERAFPRGGASVLTPIEHKQIKAQAERDVLFEQETGQKAPREDGEDDGQLFDEEAATAPAKKKRKMKSKGGETVEKSAGAAIWVQGLSYKNLIVGSTVLGYVTAITGRDVALALPNNLTGYVPITSISQTLNSRIERLLAEEEAQEKSEEDVDMKQLFFVGQWLRAVVTSTGSEAVEGGKSKRRIELTIDPIQVNGGLDGGSVVDNSMLQASIRSVEDHGIIMDLGLADNDIKGFVSKKDLGASYTLENVQEGQVMMCLVTGRGSNGKVLKLSPDTARFTALSNDKNCPVINEAPTVDCFLPGTAISVLVTDVSPGGVVGKVMGMLDITADVVHSGAGGTGSDMTKRYKIGSKVKGRIIWTLPGDDGAKRVGMSTLDHVLALPPPPMRLPENASAKVRTQAAELAQHLPLSSIVSDAKISHVLTERGLFLSLPSGPGQSAPAFAHISQVADNRIDSLSSSTGAYKTDSVHKARIISYNPLDNIYYVSLKKSTLDQAFLRLEDLTVGALVQGQVERLILGGKSGITGVLVKLSESITGLVPEVHLSDVQLQHPERKYKEGSAVKARILSVDFEKRQVRLTLKKSLLDDGENSATWKDFAGLEPGMQSKGTVIKLLANGAVVQFYGNVRAWLPVAEMSEGFIASPDQHFRLGQTISVKIVSVDPATQEMKVSCKSNAVVDNEQQAAWNELSGGAMVNGTVTEKSNDSVTLDLESGLRALIRIGQLADGPHAKAEGALKRIRVGQKLTDLLVFDKLERSRQVLLSNKSSLLQAAKAGTLVRSFDDVKEGAKVHGFVRNVTPEGVYVEFANGTVGLIPKSQVAPEMVGQAAFGLIRDQTVYAWVMKVDSTRQRFTLSMREQSTIPAPSAQQPIVTETEFSLGQVVKARIASVKTTQINVRLDGDLQGRVDVSEVFDTWEDVANKKAPLQKFQPNEEIEVKVLGIHDARNHRFLPISHRQSKALVFELSAKKSRVERDHEELLDLASVKAGRTYLAFVNNHGDNCVWVNLSPNVRGRVALMDLTDDVGLLQKLEKNFPIGSALKVSVKRIDLASARLDLTARTGDDQVALTLQDLSPGMVLPGRVTKVNERSVNVQLTDTLAGPIPLVELNDDFDQLNLGQYNKNDIVRACVLDVDLPNKKVFLTLRPSKVLSSSLPVQDPQVNSFTQLKPGDICRGFVKHVHEKGVIVSLGARVDAIVRVSDLSDKYVKDWKSIVEIDQLVKGRVISVDAATNSIQLSLKESHVNEHYTPPVTLSDLEPGMVVTGKVRKVEDFGAFIDIDNTQPRLSGLCHRSEVAAKRIEDVRKLYSAGDVVKAKILSVDVDARKISLGLKASYFADGDDEDVEVEDEEESQDEGVNLDGSSDDDEELGDIDTEGEVDLTNVRDVDSDEDDGVQVNRMDLEDDAPGKAVTGLTTSGFDWNGDGFAQSANGAVSDSEAEVSATKKRKRSKAEIKIDLTGDLDKYGPRSVSDFERQLLGQPNDSGLWIQYMAFQLQLSEIDKARQLAERALRTIHIRETDEKANIWIAWLNLEVEYGSEEQVDEVFKQACQVQDPLEMHQKLASIYIDSGKHDEADGIFDKAVGNKAFRVNPDIWFNYATFLMGTLKKSDRARALLPRAMQSITTNEHRAFTAKFAGLEFHSSQGDPERGRTIFEGLISEWPKWSTGWDTWVDLERSQLAHVSSAEAKREAKDKVRALFERMSAQKMKKRRAKFVFKRWLEFEEKDGDVKSAERVKAVARDYVEKSQAPGEDEMEE